jgi:hypothetical protein
MPTIIIIIIIIININMQFATTYTGQRLSVAVSNVTVYAWGEHVPQIPDSALSGVGKIAAGKPFE